MQDINSNINNDSQVRTCLSLSLCSWCEAVAMACTSKPWIHMAVLPYPVPYGAYAGWSPWPLKTLVVLVYLVTWFVVFSGC